MPSAIVGYVPGSGFVPLLMSGSWGSGYQTSPVTGIQLVADSNNSGNLYISYSGAQVFSGQIGLLPSSGGGTITSGSYLLSGTAVTNMDGMKLAPGQSYFVPKLAIRNEGYASGQWQVCIGADPTCSGIYGRIYWEII